MTFAIGEIYGRLTVVAFHHRDQRNRKFYLCHCECGREKIVQQTLLISRNTKSCGCLSREAKLAQRLPDDAGVINQIILQYKRHARDRAIDWNLSREAVDGIVRMACHYCGVVGGNTKKTKNHPGFQHNGIDRVDSSRAYEGGNVVPCCGLCNRAKRDMPREEFIAWACRVAAHWSAMADQWSDHVEQERSKGKWPSNGTTLLAAGAKAVEVLNRAERTGLGYLATPAGRLALQESKT